MLIPAINIDHNPRLLGLGLLAAGFFFRGGLGGIDRLLLAGQLLPDLGIFQIGPVG